MPSLGLAMIVKNAAETLRDCLASVAGLTDQIVIADTGSSDGTAQLAQDLGAQVFDSPWQDDFAQARNVALKALTTDWVLVMDDDEELDPQARNTIPHLLNHARVGGYSVTLRNYIPLRFVVGGHAPSIKPIDSMIRRAERARAYTDFAICRLFRRHPEIYYVGRVHELVEPRIARLGLELASGNLVIHHFGHLCSPDEARAKDELYRKLGRLKVSDLPDDPQSWTEIGQLEYERLKNYSAAIECFKKALSLPNHSNIPYLSLANLYIDIQANDRALELLSRVAMKGRSAGAREHICGDAFYNLGRLKEARAAYRRALDILPDDTRVVSKLGLTEVRLGLKKNGLARLTRALKVTPDVVEVHDRIIKAYILMNLLPQAAEAAERLAVGLPSPTTILRAASIRAQLKESKAVQNIILRGLRLFPQNQELLQAKAELSLETTRATQPRECNANTTPGEQGAFQENCRAQSPLPRAHCTTGLSEEESLSRP
jgi:glycosyltransferase involved in cell wall biosynthesis